MNSLRRFALSEQNCPKCTVPLRKYSKHKFQCYPQQLDASSFFPAQPEDRQLVNTGSHMFSVLQKLDPSHGA